MQDDQKSPENADEPKPDAELEQPAEAQPDTSEQQTAEPETPAKPEIVVGKGSAHSKLWWTTLIVGVLLAVGLVAYWLGNHNKAAAPSVSSTSTQTSQTSPTTTTAQQVTLDTSKNYGNKYKDGILPVGDGKYQTTGAKQGYVYACAQYARNLEARGGGAMVRGPWFTNNNTEYNINKKVHVNGSVMWSASFSNKVSGSTRTIVSNDLPTHPTGIFPIASTDPAYQYDHNPNTIKGQSFTYALAASPTYGSPTCVGGEVGVMLNGVALFSSLDAAGRDAGAWETQDNCDGHPQADGIYHYHTLSSCIKDVSVRTVIGYALDGFPISGPQVAPNNVLTTSDLDVCHGITSSYVAGGKTVTGYHYVMTEDFPYSVSCYRGTAIAAPGQQEQQSTQGTAPGQKPPAQRP